MATFPPVGGSYLDAITLSSPLAPQSPPLSDVTFITKFDTGHGWTAGATVDLNNTERPLLGAQNIKYGPADPGTHADVTGTVAGTNLTGTTLLVWVYAEDANSSGLVLYLGQTGFSQYRTYDLRTDAIEQGQWSCVKVNVDDFTFDSGSFDVTNVQAARLRIYDPTGSHELHIAGIGYMTEQTAYPNGVVTITFDDTADGIWTHARPALETHDFPAVAYVIAETAESAGGDGLSVENLQMLERDFGWEVGGHADRSTDHVDLTTLAEGEVDDRLARMRLWLARNGLTGRHFAYPFGAQNATVRAVTRRYFTTGRATGGSGLPRPHMVPAPTAGAHLLRTISFDAGGTGTVAQMQTAIDRAKAKGLWMVLTFHTVLAGASSGASIGAADFATVCDYIAAQAVPVATPSTVLGID